MGEFFFEFWKFENVFVSKWLKLKTLHKEKVYYKKHVCQISAQLLPIVLHLTLQFVFIFLHF